MRCHSPKPDNLSRRELCLGAAAGLLTNALAGAEPITTSDAAVPVRRGYADCRFGQLHYRVTQPADSAARRRTPVALFHQTPLSSRMFDLFLPVIGRDRVAYAFDNPGYGESDPPLKLPVIADYANAMADVLDALRIRKIDLLGYHTGVLVATELAILRPQLVRRLILISIPLFPPEQLAAYKYQPFEFREDGSHLMKMWNDTWKVRPQEQTIEMVARIVAEKQRAGARHSWGGHAIFTYPTAERLPKVTQPVLVVQTQSLRENTAKAKTLLRNARMIDLPDDNYGIFDVIPEKMAAHVHEFLDQKK